MTTTEIGPTQRLTVLKHLAAGKGLDVTAAMTRLSRDEVLDIGGDHGYPRADRLQHAVELLTAAIEKSDKDAAISTSPLSTGTTLPASSPPARSEPAAPHPAEPLTRPDEIRVLLNTAKSSDAKRIQNLANRIFDDLDKLKALIADDQERHAAQRAAEHEKAAARAEVQHLQEQLAAAKAKLRPATTKGTKTRRPSAAITDGTASAPASTIRAWAVEKGIDCPSRGVLPNAVRQAYALAHA